MWLLKNWHIRVVVLEKILESPLDSKEIKAVNPKRNQSCKLIGRTDAEALPDGKSQLVGKDPDSRKDWGQEKKGIAEDEMVERHHQLHRHELEQTPGDSEGRGA